MENIVITIIKFPKEHPIKLIISIISLCLMIFFGRYGCINYAEGHTPKLEIVETFFRYEPIPDGNVTGIFIKLANQSSAWAKKVNIDFINDDGYSKYEKIKYLRSEKVIVALQEISPNNPGILDGWCPQGPALSPRIYQTNEKKYIVDIFIDWENENGKRYSLVTRYESLADNFAKQIRFKPVYKYDTLKNKAKVLEIKKENRAYLPDDML